MEEPKQTTMNKVIITCIALVTLLFTIIGAAWSASTTIPKWQQLEVQEKITSIVSINNIHIAISETDYLYGCQVIVEGEACRYHPYQNDIELVKAQMSNEIKNSSDCRTVQDSLSRFIGQDIPIVSCALQYFADSQKVHVAFLVDENGSVWRWTSTKRGIMYDTLRGGFIGALVAFIIFALILTVKMVIQSIASSWAEALRPKSHS